MGFEPENFDGLSTSPLGDGTNQLPTDEDQGGVITPPTGGASYQGLSADQEADSSLELSKDGLFCHFKDPGVVDSSYKQIRIFLSNEMGQIYLKMDVLREVMLDGGDREIERLQMGSAIRVDSEVIDFEPGIDHYSTQGIFDLYFNSDRKEGRLYMVLDQREIRGADLDCETHYNDYTRTHGDDSIESRTGK